MPGYHLPYFTAAATGLYDRHGLDVEIVYPEPGPDNIRAVAAGRYDVCLTSVAHFLKALSEEPDLGARFVFMIARRSHMSALFVAGRPAAHGRRLVGHADLAGASYVGEEDSPFTREYMALLGHLGFDRPETIPLPYGEVKEGLAAGKGDVAADYVDLLPDYQAAARTHDADVAALMFHDAGIDVYGSGLVAGTDLIAARPEVVEKTAAAIRDALVVTHDDPSAGADALLARFPDAGRERAISGWTAGQELIFGPGELGVMDDSKWARTIDYHSATHGTGAVTPARVWDPSFP